MNGFRINLFCGHFCDAIKKEAAQIFEAASFLLGVNFFISL